MHGPVKASGSSNSNSSSAGNVALSGSGARQGTGTKPGRRQEDFYMCSAHCAHGLAFRKYANLPTERAPLSGDLRESHSVSEMLCHQPGALSIVPVAMQSMCPTCPA